jgi:hypothetical protein
MYLNLFGLFHVRLAVILFVVSYLKLLLGLGLEGEEEELWEKERGRGSCNLQSAIAIAAVFCFVNISTNAYIQLANIHINFNG